MTVQNNELYEEIIIAGFGGQGIILTGKVLAQAAMLENKHVTYMPSYGAEVRGGTANCMVVISSHPIASPLLTNPSSLVAMNKASLHKFAPRVKPAGLIILNSSLIDQVPQDLPPDVQILELPADDIAVELGNKRIANMAALGAYLTCRNLFTTEICARALEKTLAKRYHNLLDINIRAIEQGSQYAQQALNKTA